MRDWRKNLPQERWAKLPGVSKYPQKMGTVVPDFIGSHPMFFGTLEGLGNWGLSAKLVVLLGFFNDV